MVKPWTKTMKLMVSWKQIPLIKQKKRIWNLEKPAALEYSSYKAIYKNLRQGK